jgi:hypothetical protein
LPDAVGYDGVPGRWKRLSGTESGRKENMAKRFLCGGLVLALSAYVGYHSYDARRSGVSGDVFSNDPPKSTGKTGSSAKTANCRCAGRRAGGQGLRFRWGADCVSVDLEAGCSGNYNVASHLLHGGWRHSGGPDGPGRAGHGHGRRSIGRYDQSESTEWDGLLRDGKVSAIPPRQHYLAGGYRDGKELHSLRHGRRVEEAQGLSGWMRKPVGSHASSYQSF